jgi:anti-sigma-K factor RskA
MSQTDCAVFQDAAAELALGILSGPDRAAALKHMERCASCQSEVASLAAATDRLLDLVPERGAPDGFESRMAAAFRQSVPGQAGRRHRGKAACRRLAGWWRRAGLAAAAAAAAGALGLGLHQIGAPQEPAYSGAEVAALRTPAGVPAGEVAVTGAPQPLLVMVLNPGAAPGWYHCYLRTSGGRQAFAGAFHVGRGGVVWMIRPPMPPRDLAGARLVGPGGTEIASATFT